MAGSRMALLGLLVASCAPFPATAPAVVAPYPVQYTCAQQRALAAEYRALPAGSMLARAMDDYRTERGALRALHGISDAACP